MEDNNFLHGLVGTPVRKAFEKSGLKYSFFEIPPKRQLLQIKNNKEKICGLGWFKNTEREQYGKFTSPVYRDSVFIALALSTNIKLKDKKYVEDLFNDKNIVLIKKSGFSYGKYIDTLLKKLKPRTETVSSSIDKIFYMLLAGRGDYFFVSYEEALQLIIQHDIPFSKFNMIFLKNNQKGEYRYIFCSKKVTDYEIQLINRGLKK